MDKQKKPAPGDQSNFYTRTRVQHAGRVFGMLVLIALNVAMIGSLYERASHGFAINPGKEILFLLFVLFVDATLLLPIVFEVDSAKVEPDKLLLKTTLFKRSIAWSDIIELRSPIYMKIAILRTKRCFYLINKRQISRYDELGRAITDKLKLLETKT